MNRPLMQHGVGQLEQLFASSKTDQKVLKQLESELRFRQVPRAVSLLAEVQAALYSPPVAQPKRSKVLAPADDLGGILSSPPVQPPLWGLPLAEDVDARAKPPLSPLATTSSPLASTPPRTDLLVEARGSRERGPAPEMPLVTLADAYKLFKATPSSTWESIEQTRRQAVQASSPTRLSSMDVQQHDEVREQAKRFNAAYEVLSRARLAA